MAHGYRPDIDGLRAIAILLVVMFHAFPGTVRGGFVGVDIFFVISGFLISGIVLKGLRQGTFSFTTFYVGRACRIFPALILVLAASYAYGWFALLPGEFAQLGRHIAAGAGFVQNFVLWSEAGYFDTASHLKPLLHLWSLAIEEQFYLSYPLLLWWAYRRSWGITALFILLLVSFGANVLRLVSDPVGGFFLSHVRFWELLVGGIGASAYAVFYDPSRDAPARWKSKYKGTLCGLNAREPLAWLGLLLVVIAAFGLSQKLRYPGWWALIPVMGTLILLMSGPDTLVSRRILSHPYLIQIGLISYPLYLWHWPLLSMAHLASGSPPSSALRGLLLVAASGLAWLTYEFLERPIRFGNHRTQWAGALSGMLLGTIAVGVITSSQNGITSRDIAVQSHSYTQSVQRTSRAKECFEIPHAYERSDAWFCVLGASADSSPALMAYGDSHALSLIPALEQYGFSRQTPIAFAGTSGCPPLLGVQSLRGASDMALHNCQKLNERIFNFVKTQGIKRVLLIGRWTYYTGGLTKPEDHNQITMDMSRNDNSIEFSRESFVYGLRNTVMAYRRLGVQVYLMQDTPQQLLGPINALKRANLSVERVNDYAVSFDQHHKDQAWVRERLEEARRHGAVIIDGDKLMCDSDGKCPIAKNGRSNYFDSDHLSVVGAMNIYPELEASLAKQ